MKKRCRNVGGFTLLEVAIALAIVAVAFVSLTMLFNTSLGITDYSRRMTKAVFLAQKLMTDIEFDHSIALGGAGETELEEEFEGYSYSVEVTESVIPFIQEVNLNVFFDSVLNRHSLTVTNYMILDTENLIEETGEEPEEDNPIADVGEEK
jgi:general secretion pathway protein I